MLLFQTLPSDSTETVSTFISQFHVNVIKKIVDILKLEPREIDPEMSMPDVIKKFIFG